MMFGKANGLIVESGRGPYALLSSTHLFESFAKWTAVHVEAEKRVFTYLREHRDRSVNIHAALSSNNTKLEESGRGVKFPSVTMKFLAKQLNIKHIDIWIIGEEGSRISDVESVMSNL
jgi:hypothetical protein